MGKKSYTLTINLVVLYNSGINRPKAFNSQRKQEEQAMDTQKHTVTCDMKPLDELSLSDETLAFLHYVIKVTDQIDVELEEIFFAPCNVKFGLATARWVTVFNNDVDDLIEYWIIYKDDKASALATKYIESNGTQNVAFTQFILHPINHEGVTSLINKLPSAIDVARNNNHASVNLH